MQTLLRADNSAVRKLDSAMFWLAAAAVLIGAGGVGVAVGTAGLAPNESLREPWFILGVVLAFLGIAAFVWALIMYVRARRSDGPPPLTGRVGYRGRPGALGRSTELALVQT